MFQQYSRAKAEIPWSRQLRQEALTTADLDVFGDANVVKSTNQKVKSQFIVVAYQPIVISQVWLLVDHLYPKSPIYNKVRKCIWYQFGQVSYKSNNKIQRYILGKQDNSDPLIKQATKI